MSQEIQHFDASNSEELRLEKGQEGECETYIRAVLADLLSPLELESFQFDQTPNGWRIASVSCRTEPRDTFILYDDPEVPYPSFRDITNWVRRTIEHLGTHYGDGDPFRGLLSVIEARMRNDDPLAFLRAGLLGEGDVFPGLVLVDGLTDEEMIECCDDGGHQGSSMEFITFTVEPQKRWEEQRTRILGFARALRRHGRPFFLVNTISPTELRIGIAPAVGAQYAVPRPLQSAQEESGPTKEAA